MPWEGYPVTLEEIGDGAAVDLFEAGVREVLQDIGKADRKTSSARSFCLKFTFQADENGQSTSYKIERVNMKLAPTRAAVGGATLAHKGGQLEMLDVRQTHDPNMAPVVGINDGGKEDG